MALIETKNLSKTYHLGETSTKALVNATIKIDSGEFVAVMGPSGSGKSTLLHILGFLDNPSGGEYFFDGKESREYDGDERAYIRNFYIGFVFQAFNLLPRTSVLDNVMLPLLYSRVPKKEWQDRAKILIDSVGLSHRINYNPSVLSGGEKQRAAIARALVNNPKIIFADEPTGNLDSESGCQILDLLTELNKKNGHTIVLITHEKYTAESAERIINIKDGKVMSDEKINNRRPTRFLKK